ncbi:MAG: protein phosphatase CheZ [Oleibacter sp.]|nr:protein phosphatase CheZ [Thalassolituus sp.]
MHTNREINTNPLSAEMKTLAENLLSELDKGDVKSALALVNTLNSVRDQTLFNEIGKLTRALHDSIRNIDIDGENTSSDLDYTRNKLTYVLEMTGKSANTTLDLADASVPLVNEISESSNELSKRWQQFLRRELSPDDFRELTRDIGHYLDNTAVHSNELRDKISQIVLAQDFQDLTGQIIHKVADLIIDVEKRLVSLVSMAASVDQITGISHESAKDENTKSSDQLDIVADGPQINSSSSTVSNQDDVDDLLSSLGF